MSKQNLNFTVSSQIIHPDNELLTDMHSWTVFLAEYTPGVFTVFSNYSLNTMEHNLDGSYKSSTPSYTKTENTKRFDTIMEATYYFNRLTLQAFSNLRGEAYINISQMENLKCLTSTLPQD